ncbi:spore coat protein YsxE [Bacillus sp. FJAT-47783]|uniref:spore coat protein YsxE n=1 Tax=Bacillus sp. FJAT-47783 TaxID=2922712 RepID=UPI001FAC7C0F|nr:spore coat protein YsxE [Bacillus sp. FJAT-47783]
MSYEELSEVCKEYNLRTNYIERVTDKVLKIHTDKGTYAIKKIPAEKGKTFIQNYTILMQSSYQSYIPIYPTRQNEWFVNKGESIYYVMPWVPQNMRDDQKHTELELYEALAHLHLRTKKEWKFEEKDYEHHYAMVLSKWEQEENLFEQFVERCEKRWYMSPFELQAVLFFTETMQASQMAKQKLNEWYESLKKKPVARIVLNHGHISSSHLLKDERDNCYLTNFERAYYGAPIHDLIFSFQRKLTSFPIQCDECIGWLEKYEQTFALTDGEKKLFLSYLAYPSPIFRIVEQYNRKDGKRVESSFCRKMMKRYWLMKNCEYVVMKWLELENQKEQSETPSS